MEPAPAWVSGCSEQLPSPPNVRGFVDLVSIGTRAPDNDFMTVLLGLTESRLSRLGHRIRDGEEFTVTIPEQLVRPHRRWRLCFLIAEAAELEQSDHMPLVDTSGVPSIIGVARLRGSGRPTTTDERVTVADPELVDPPLKLRQLGDSNLAMLSRVTPDTAIEIEGQRNDDLIHSVLSLRPDLIPTIDDLSRYHGAEPIAGDEGDVLALERDAVHLALSFAGFDVDDTATWDAAAEGSYLNRLRYAPREEVLSRYDASRFPHWQPLAGNRVEWRLFTDGQRSLRVGDVNATKLERILGVDLIYRHLESDTFVLVQYKKMRRDAHGKWSYRPDAQLDAELERMRKVDTTAVEAAADPATCRLYPRGCFLKLVRPPEFFDPTSDRLLNGIYLPLLYLDELFAAHPEGTRPHLGYDTIDRYMTAELFVALVRQGWIGTRGVTTRAIQKLVDAAVGAQHSVIIAEETGQQPGRTRRRDRRTRILRAADRRVPTTTVSYTTLRTRNTAGQQHAGSAIS